MTNPRNIAQTVEALPGNMYFSPATKGRWSAGPVTCIYAAKITSEGRPAIKSAQCLFTFVGSYEAGLTTTPVSGVSQVELKPPSSTLLKEKGGSLLIDGDSAKDSYGNALQALMITSKLKTA